VLLEAAARDARLRAVVADGPTRPMDDRRVRAPSGVLGAARWPGLQTVRGLSGMRPAHSLLEHMPRIAPRPVLLVAAGGAPAEIPANRLYRRAGGPSARLWELPDAGHTAGLRTHAAEYERRSVGFLDDALAIR
jgi:fermentation-respiration switch protein FrsA (DUF1100 family)